MMEYERLTQGKITKDKSIVLIRNERGVVVLAQEVFNMFVNVYKRLAELEDKIEQGTLIEQKTCKNISEIHPVDGFTCSECGISLEDYSEKEVDEESGDITYREYMLRYCPNCGAKVVEE